MDFMLIYPKDRTGEVRIRMYPEGGYYVESYAGQADGWCRDDEGNIADLDDEEERNALAAALRTLEQIVRRTH